jgi:hypothetical protein
LEVLEDRTVPSITNAWDGGGGDFDWNDPLNWSTDTVPGVNDDVVINAPGVTITNNSATAHSISSLSLAAGTLTGTDELTVIGPFTWTGGTLAGNGSLTANGGMTISGPSSKALDGSTLTNAGAAVWIDGRVAASNGATINNLLGATFDVHAEVPVVSNPIPPLYWTGTGAVPVFNNDGTFTKVGSLGNGRTFFRVIFHNSGTLNALDGNLLLGIDSFSAVPSTSSGTYTTNSYTPSPGAGAQTEGDWIFTASSSISGAGMAFADGNVLVAGSHSVSGGTVLSNASVTFTGAVTSLGFLEITNHSTATFSPVAPILVDASRVSLMQGTLVANSNLRLHVSGNYQQDSTSALDLALGNGTDFSQVQVAGTVQLAGSLSLRLVDGFSPTIGQTYTIINNLGSGAVTGAFAGLPEGTIVGGGCHGFQISYVGGNGNDVTVTYINLTPPVTIAGPSDGVRGQTRTFTLSVDPTSAAGFTYTIDWGDGSPIQTLPATPGNGAGVTVDHIFTASGSYTILVTANDDDGCASEPAAHVVTISVVALQADPCQPGLTALAVGGTLGNDSIVFSPTGNAGEVQVQLNGTSLGTFTPTGSLLAYGQDGNDDIQVAGSLSQTAWLYGQGGNDRLKGGAGHDLLFGGAGDDLLVGGAGRDLLVGGTGADRIVGNAADDIIIAGTTAYDGNVAALCAIMAEWTSGRSYDERTANLRGAGSTGVNGSYVLQTDGAGATVFDDGAADVLTGSQGQDWFFANLNSGVLDCITDLSAAEFAADLDFIQGP